MSAALLKVTDLLTGKWRASGSVPLGTIPGLHFGDRQRGRPQPLADNVIRELLERGSDTVDTIGYRVGYEDPAFFRRLFKRTTGLTPAVYRRKYAAMGTNG